jgi:hypothetical protein
MKKEEKIMSRNAALRYDKWIKSPIFPPQRPTLHLFRATGGDGAMSRDRGVAAPPWDDAAFGFKHWHQFKRIAVVTESAWLLAAMTMFCPFFPRQIQLFKSPSWMPRKHGSAAKREQVRDGGSI